MRVFLLVFHLLLTLVMIGVILIQRGEDASAGSGSGGGLPGSRSGKNFLTHVTAVLAAVFFANCLIMAILVRRDSKLGMVQKAVPDQSLDRQKPEATPKTKPATVKPTSDVVSLPPAKSPVSKEVVSLPPAKEAAVDGAVLKQPTIIKPELKKERKKKKSRSGSSKKTKAVA